MNIQEAKEEIKRTLHAYHSKDAYGNYRYPVRYQRPLLLIGPPGIGKTAIVEQIAQEEGIGLVSYTMTHHTRQSAIGLPRILEKKYDGHKVTMTSYTLSEIIASVYECIERTGSSEGILFIDEINCVSETLAPVMLQFLQNKQFGAHKIPDGFMIVAAGNPHQYNRSAKDFDIVTLDRVRRMDVEASLDCWSTYALQNHIHSSILAYLNLHPEHFFMAQSSAATKTFVTPRGWEDLSRLLTAYEELGESIREDLFPQFLGEEHVARGFSSYYKLFQKYGEDYAVREILAGSVEEEIYDSCVDRTASAPFDERLTVMELLLAGMVVYLEEESLARERRQELLQRYDQDRAALQEGGSMEKIAEDLEKVLDIQKEQGLLSEHETDQRRRQIARYHKMEEEIRLQDIRGVQERIAYLDTMAEEAEEEEQLCAVRTANALDQMFVFGEEAFRDDQLLLLLVTRLSADKRAMEHITKYGCEAFEHWAQVLGG